MRHQVEKDWMGLDLIRVRHVDPNRPRRLPPEQRRQQIINLLRDGPKTSSQLQYSMGLSGNGLKYYLKCLVDDGRIEKLGLVRVGRIGGSEAQWGLVRPSVVVSEPE